MKIAVIGCGKQGQRHLASLRGLAEPIVADRDDARASAMAARFGVARQSVEAILAAPAIAAIIIATPTPFHAELADAAIAAGKHVLCEKPFGEDARVARRLADAASRRALVGRVGYLYRFAPAILAARGAMEQLGRIDSAHFAIAAAGSHAAWKHRRDQGGGVVNELVSHMADLAGWFFGPMRLDAVVERRPGAARRTIDGGAVAVDADDCCVARLTARSGAAVTIAGDFAAPCFSQWLRIDGEKGSLRASIDPAYDGTMQLGTVSRRLAPAGETDLYRLQARSFIDAVARRGGAPDGACDFVEAAQARALLDAVQAAPVGMTG